MKKVLHFSPISKSSEIVKIHLNALESLNLKNVYLTYSFFDDTIDVDSSNLISDFLEKKSNSIIWNISDLPKKENNGDRWSKNAYERVTIIKDFVIEQFLNSDSDYLFLTDSDLVLHPLTLKHLLDENKDFISMVFWTHFKGRNTYFPNAWMNHPKTFPTSIDFISLKQKQVIPVDFTGACTLLSRKILEKGVRFKKVPQLKALGEDKHFCVRAGVHNFQPHLSTYYPAFHIYSDNLISKAIDWVESDYSYAYLNSWLDQNWEQKIKKFYNSKPSNLYKLKKIVKKFLT